MLTIDPPPRAHVGDDFLTTVEGAAEVDLHLSVHILVPVELEKRLLRVKVTGVVDQDVDAAECVDRLFDHGFDGCALTDIGTTNLRFAAGLFDGPGDTFRTVLSRQIVDENAAAPSPNVHRHRRPDLAAGAGHQRDLS